MARGTVWHAVARPDARSVDDAVPRRRGDEAGRPVVHIRGAGTHAPPGIGHHDRAAGHDPDYSATRKGTWMTTQAQRRDEPRLASSPTAHPSAVHLPRPAAVRVHRPGWRDPRLLLGLVLVGGSVLLGSWVLGDAARTTPVVVAREALVAGDRLTPDAVEIQEVRLPAAHLYLGPEDLGSGVLVRTVGAGEVVPRAAVAAEGDLDVRAVGVDVARVAPGVRAGAVVDLWFVPAPGSRGETSETPRALAVGLVVAEVAQADTTFSIGRGTTVHVLVPTEALPGVLGALAAPGTVEVVAVAGGAG